MADPFVTTNSADLPLLPPPPHQSTSKTSADLQLSCDHHLCQERERGRDRDRDRELCENKKKIISDEGGTVHC